MDKNLARLAGMTLEDAARKAFAAHPQLKHLKLTYGGGRFDSVEFTAKITLRDTVAPVAAPAVFGKALTDEFLHAGLAPAGTPITFADPAAPNRRGKGIILKARRSKYIFQHLGRDGKEMLIPFTACKLDLPPAPALGSPVTAGAFPTV